MTFVLIPTDGLVTDNVEVTVTHQTIIVVLPIVKTEEGLLSM